MRFTFSYHAHNLPNRIVKDYLEQHDIAHQCAKEGEIEILSAVSSENLCGLQSFLTRYGLQVIDDEKAIFVQRIKNILVEIAYSENMPSTTLSTYLCDQLGYSYAHLAATFEKLTLCSIEKYLILLKIERAKRLIMEDQLPLKEISSLLHYSSSGHLSKQFKKITGVSISTFRKIIEIKKERMTHSH